MELNSKTHRLCFTYVIVTSTFLFILSGYYLVLDGNKFEFNYFSLTAIAFSFIILTFLAVTLNVFAFLAAKRTEYVSLITVTAFLYIIFILVLIISLFGLIYVNTQHEYADDIKMNMIKAMNQYKESAKNKCETLKFNWLQMRFNCCGVEKYSDWKTHLHTENAIYKPTNLSVYIDDVPDTCCKLKFKNCGKVYSDDKDKLIHLDGCFTKYVTSSIRKLNRAFTVGFIVSLTNILSIGILTVGITRNLISSYTKIDIS